MRFKIRRFKKEDFKIYVGNLQEKELLEIGVYVKDNDGGVIISNFDTKKVILRNKFSDEAKVNTIKSRY